MAKQPNTGILKATIISRGALTETESQVLRLMCEGYYLPEICILMNRARGTISVHISHIAGKLCARGSTQIVVVAQQLGLIHIETNFIPLEFEGYSHRFSGRRQSPDRRLN